MIRVRLAHGVRAEMHEFSSEEVTLGRHPDCDLVLEHASVRPRHARILVRRGRIIVVGLSGPRGMTRSMNECVGAPFVLDRGQTFMLGHIEVAGWLADPESEPGLSGSRSKEWVHVIEIDSPDHASRRYRLIGADARMAEFSLPTRTRDLDRSAWLEGLRRPPAQGADPSGATPVVTTLFGAEGLLEVLPHGLRLSALLRGLRALDVRVPAAARFGLMARLLERVLDHHQEHGPHGQIEPRRIHLGAGGAPYLLWPSPCDPWRDEAMAGYLSRRRRLGAPPSLFEDACSVRRLCARFLRETGPPRPKEGLLASSTSEIETAGEIEAMGEIEDRRGGLSARRGGTLVREMLEVVRHEAHRLDATEADVGRLVRLILPDPARPIGARRGAGPVPTDGCRVA